MVIDSWDLLLTLILLPWLWRAFFFVRVLVSAARFKPDLSDSAKLTDDSLPLFVILIPAHNEEDSIANTLSSLAGLDYPPTRLEFLVIADNCSDATALIVKRAGVSVIERMDAERRGKGYALEYAIDFLQKRERKPDAVVVIDADTKVDRHLLTVFALHLREGKSWLQAYYTVANPEDGWRTKLMTYALSLFNGIWLMGQDRLGLGSALRGNGMCFRWSALERCPLQAYGLAEDLEFSWRLRLAGEHVVFAATTRVYGEMVSQGQAAVSQRQRWETGRKALRQDFRLAILQATQFSLLRRSDLLADLYMWPLGRLLTVTLLALLGLGLKLSLLAPSLYGLVLLVMILAFVVLFAGYGLLPFRKLALPWSYGLALIYAPAYFAWKFVVGLKRAPERWVRTARKKEL